MTPLVVDGVMYVAAVNEVRALDARTGQQIWQFARPQTPGLVPTGDPASGINRAIAVLGNRVFLQTDHAHLLAVDRRNGQVHLGRRDGGLSPELRRHRRTAHRQRSRHCGHLCRRRRSPRIPRCLSCIDRRTRVAFLDGACARRAGIGDVDRQGARARVCDDVADGIVRSGGPTSLLADRQSLPRLQRRRAQGRQLVLVVRHRARSCDRTTAMAFSVHAARPARLGCEPAAAAHRRRFSRDARGSCSPSRIAMDSSTCSIDLPARC